MLKQIPTKVNQKKMKKLKVATVQLSQMNFLNKKKSLYSLMLQPI